MKRRIGKGFIQKAILFAVVSGVTTVSIVGVSSAKNLEVGKLGDVNTAHCTNLKGDRKQEGEPVSCTPRWRCCGGRDDDGVCKGWCYDCN